MQKVNFFIFSIIPLGFLAGCMPTAKKNDSSSQQIVFSADDRFSASFSKEIIAYAQECKSPIDKQFIQAVQERFPAIADVTIRKQPRGTIECCITAARPHCLINNSHVIINDGLVCSADIYNSEVLDGLARVALSSLDQAAHDASHLVAFVSNAPLSMISDYHLTWKDAHTVVLEDLPERAVSILINPHELSLEKLSLIKNIIAENATIHSDKKRWVADARFEHQVILYQDKKGA